MSYGPRQEPRFRHAPAVDLYDPGPVPDERPERPPLARSGFPSNRVIELEEAMQQSWRKLVAEARESGDLNVLNAARAFHRDLQLWLAR